MAAQWLGGPGRPFTRFGEKPNFDEGLYRLSPRAYAWMVPNGSWGETNIGFVDCGGQSLLIDTCWDLRFTSEALAAFRDMAGGSPIERVVNTHADGDHCWGNQLFAGREIIASHACIRQMRHLTPRRMRVYGAVGAALDSAVLGGIGKLGHYLRNMLQPYDFSAVRLTEASSGFSGEKTIVMNGVEIALIEVGPGHTAGDVIVHAPGERVVYAADILFVGVTPVVWAGPVENIVAALERLLALDVDTIVPGHGPLATRADVARVIDYWDFAQEGLRRRFEQGMEAAQAARDLVSSRAFRESPFAQWDSPERMTTNAVTIYRGWGAEGLPGLVTMFRHQAALAFDMPRATPRIMRRFG